MRAVLLLGTCKLAKLWNCDTGAMSERKAVIKNADMVEEMQQEAVDVASQVSWRCSMSASSSLGLINKV